MNPTSYTEWLNEIPDEEIAYYEAIERYFSQRGGFPWIIRGKDWLIAAQWYQQGIPLHVIQQAIDAYFEKYGHEEAPRFLGFVEPFVRQAWRNYRTSLVGYLASQSDEPVTPDIVHIWFENWRIALEKASMIAHEKGWTETSATFQKFIRSLQRLEKKWSRSSSESFHEHLNELEESLDRFRKRLYREIRKSLPEDERTYMEEAVQADTKNRLQVSFSSSGMKRIVRERLNQALQKMFNLPEFSVLPFLDKESNP